MKSTIKVDWLGAFCACLLMSVWAGIGCGRDSIEKGMLFKPRLYVGLPCPDYWNAQYQITDCRAATRYNDPGKQLLASLSTPQFRSENLGCQGLKSKLVQLLSDATTEANTIWVKDYHQAAGVSFESHEHGIMLDGLLFAGASNLPGDPYASERLRTALHELSHREYKAPDPGNTLPGYATGGPTADDIASFCSRQSNTDPWTGTDAGFSGSGNPSSGTQTCDMIHIDYYMYYPATGELVYERTDVVYYCYKSS